jgi:allantoinase
MQPSRTGPFPYTPIIKRPPLKWPNNKRLALWVIPNIETFALDEKIAEGSGKIPDVSAWAKREYGNRVGVFRLMKVMERYGVRGTVALNSEVCDAAPAVIEEGMRLGWEFMGHGESNTRRLSDAKSIDEERLMIRRTLDRIETACGKRPRGWLGPGLAETWNSVDLLAEEGVRYIGDWTIDDQPYLMTLAKQKLVSIPYGHDLGDKNAATRWHYSPAEFTQMIIDTFNVLYRESAESGRVMPISLHPYITGVPHRIDSLDRGLAYICRHDDVWLATGSEIIDAYLNSGATF